MNNPVAEVGWVLAHHQGYNALCTLYCTDGLLLDDVYGEKKRCPVPNMPSICTVWHVVLGCEGLNNMN